MISSILLRHQQHTDLALFGYSPFPQSSITSAARRVSHAFRSYICVLNGNVDMWPLTGEPGQGWSRIECPSKKAYGCGKSMEAAVQDLCRLYVRLGDGPLVTSTLAIRMTDEAVRRFSSEELDEGGGGADRRKDKELPKIFPVGRILKFEQDLIVIGLSFVGKGCPDDLFYFLLYDSIETRHCP
jgi:hypothetical protein